MSGFNMRFVPVLFATIYLSSNIYSVNLGTWHKNPVEITSPAAHPVNFVLVKTGVFSKTGALKKTLTDSELSTLCQKAIPLESWVTHRLSEKEILSPEAGTRLGRELANGAKGTCLRRIEIDLEPLKEATPWLLAFFLHLKRETQKLEIRLAIPHDWTEESIRKILAIIDGVDWMLYDTEIRTAEKYQALIQKALRFSLQNGADKQIVLGFPAYQDKTRKHLERVENLASVLNALKIFEPSDLAPLCQQRIRFSLYAGWTLGTDERTHAKKLEEWYSIACGATR